MVAVLTFAPDNLSGRTSTVPHVGCFGAKRIRIAPNAKQLGNREHWSYRPARRNIDIAIVVMSQEVQLVALDLVRMKEQLREFHQSIHRGECCRDDIQRIQLEIRAPENATDKPPRHDPR